MRRAIPIIETSLVLAVVVAAGCNCGQATEPTRREPVQAAEAPAEDAAKPERKRADYNIARTGTITATVAGSPIEFSVLPPDRNRFVVSPKMSLVMIEGRPSPDAKESLAVRLQGYDIKRSVANKGALVPNREEKVAVAIVTYVDAEGTQYQGAVSRDGGLELVLDTWESKVDGLKGTFSGTLYTKDKSKSVVVENGEFSTQRAPT